MSYLRLYRVKDWLHFLPLPLAGWLAAHAGLKQLAGGLLAWAFGLAYTSAINQAFDDRLDRADKNPVGARFTRRQALWLSLPPALATLALLALLSPEGLPAGAVMILAATLYSAPPRLKRIPVVGTLWNLVIGVPGFFFAGRPPVGELPLKPLVGIFALLLLISQLLHEAQDRDDDFGQVRTVATVAGRPAALTAALIFVVATPAAAWWLAAGAPRRLAIALVCVLFAILWSAVLAPRLRCDDRQKLGRLRLGYRYTVLVVGTLVFAAVWLPAM